MATNIQNQFQEIKSLCLGNSNFFISQRLRLEMQKLHLSLLIHVGVNKNSQYSQY